MNNSTFLSILCASVLAITSMTAHAVLVDRSNGTIYESVNNKTWLQNANYAVTELSDVRVDEIIAAVVSVDGHTLNTTDFKFYGNGQPYQSMSAWGAIAWADQLVFGGFDDWRLPTTPQFPKYPVSTIDPNCSSDIRGALFFEHRSGCTDGEMEGLTAVADPFTNPLFFNVIATRYWTATPYRDGTDPCFGFPGNGYDVDCVLANDNGSRTDFYWQWDFAGDSVVTVPYKTTLKAGNGRLAWPVRDNCGFNVALAANTWTMIGLTCAPIETVNTVKFVFGDDLDVAQYGNRWVVYEWNADTNSYSKMPLDDPLKPLSQNRGYWILSLDAANLDSEGDDTAAVVSVSGGCAVTQGCYEIPLTPPAGVETEQYNLVGHAFSGTIPWKDVRIKTTVGTTVSVYTPSGALAADIMDKTIWKYNGNGYNSYDDVTAGKLGQLDAFDGFWVRTLPGASAVITTLLLPKVPLP